MRPVLHGDVAATACALFAVAPQARAGLLRRILAEAEGADQFRRATGRAHWKWGNGSLMAAAMAHPRRREPFLDNPEYCCCMVQVFQALADRAQGLDA